MSTGASAQVAETPAPWLAPTARTAVTGVARLPGSKSLTSRALILAAIADGPSTIRGALASRDTDLMATALQAMGADVRVAGADRTVTPGTLRGPASVDCGLAGTVMRFVPPVAALADGAVRFDGDPRSRLRPMRAMLDALRDLGVDIDDERGGLPFTVLGNGSVRGGRVEIDASASSQFVSALLLVGARYDDGVEVAHVGPPMPSLPHVEMSVDMLRRHGVQVETPAPTTWSVRPGLVQAADVTIEPDLSNAAPFVAAAAVTNGEVHVPGWPARTTQPGDRLRDILQQMGAEVRLDETGLTVRGQGTLRGIDLDLQEIGELTPAVAALAALADSPSVLHGVAHIRGHETDRISALATELRALGGDVVERVDGLEIRPATLHGGPFHTYADHRMVHAAAILGLAVPGILVDDAATSAKTFPGFPAAWQALVAGDDAAADR